jgi:hypothetical protein
VTDTTPEAAEVQRRILREMSVAQRIRATSELCESTRRTSLAGIRQRHPDYSEQDARFALWRMLYGDELFHRAWPQAPLLAP